MVKESSWMLNSPDGNIVSAFELSEGQLFYSIQYKGDTVVERSNLGATRSDTDLSNGLLFLKNTDVVEFTEEFTLITGKQLNVTSKGVQQSITFTNQKGSQLQLDVKVFNDGLALRYAFPDSSDQPVTILEDKMSFAVPKQSLAWLQPYDKVTTYTPAYERYFENGINSDIQGEFGNGWCMPALFNAGDHWMLISEAGIDGDISGSHLDNDGGSSVYRLRWPEQAEALGLGDGTPSSTLPWHTSWKTIMIGDLNSIVKSDLVKVVSPATRIKNTGWIKPGRSSWSWLSDHPSPKNYKKLKSFVDLAAEMDWEYSLVDANWDKMEGGSIVELIDYASSKGVGILMWYNSGGPHNEVTEAPRDLISDPTRRKQEFEKLRKWGVKGIKVDFFQSDKQFMMELYRDILEDAAASNIMVNFHGCAIPRGWSRTYPNLMTMESVRGAESYTFAGDYPENAPVLNTILPFTRNIVGSMDYTPVIFTDMKYPHITTYGHEMALSILFETGWLHFGDAVEGYRELGEIERQFLKELPVTWDQVELIQGTPGKDVVIARRKGESWYVAGINGTANKQTWQLDLTRLKEGDSSTITKIVDGTGPKELFATTANESGIFSVDILPYGGFALKLEPVVH